MATAAGTQHGFFPRPFWTVATALTLARIVVLVLSEAELGPDEAQYWYWSRDLAFGYYSKPPMIAWAIGLTTGLFGNGEWAVRLAAPLFHLGASAFIYLLAKRAFDETVAFWAGLGWLVMPGVTLASFVIATDAPLLFFWSGALYALTLILDRPDGRPAKPLAFAGLGVMIGLGLMSKYAMMYFPAALGIAMILSGDARRALWRPALLISALIALALFAPNIAWNALNGFYTLAHTADNVDLGGALFHPLALADFLAGQFAVFGPIAGAAFIWSLARLESPLRAGDDKPFQRTLLVFALTPIVIVSVSALLSRAHANWAATAYPAATILVTVWLFEQRRAWIAKASIALHGLVLAAFSVLIVDFAIPDRLGLAYSFAGVRGWRTQTEIIAAHAPGFDAIVIDDRYLMSEALYDLRGRDFEIVSIDSNRRITDHFEAFKAFDPDRHKRVLFASILPCDAHVSYRFRNITPLGPAEVIIGGRRRAYHLFDISGYFEPGPSPEGGPPTCDAVPR